MNILFFTFKSHKLTIAACQLRRKQSKVQKLEGFWKRRWPAWSKLCRRLDEEDLNLGQKVNKLPHPSPAKRRHVRPKIDALQRAVNGGNVCFQRRPGSCPSE